MMVENTRTLWQILDCSSQSGDEPCTLVAVPEVGMYRFFVEDILHRKVEKLKDGKFFVWLNARSFHYIKEFSIKHEVVTGGD